MINKEEALKQFSLLLKRHKDAVSEYTEQYFLFRQMVNHRPWNQNNILNCEKKLTEVEKELNKLFNSILNEKIEDKVTDKAADNNNANYLKNLKKRIYAITNGKLCWQNGNDFQTLNGFLECPELGAILLEMLERIETLEKNRGKQ